MAAGGRGAWARTGAIVALAFTLGVGATALLNREDEPDEPEATLDDVSLADANESIDAVNPEVSVRGESAGSAEAAVRGFLDAEQAGEFERSFDYLSDTNRSAFGSPAGYLAAHADLVPPVTGYTVEQVTGDTVVVEVRYVPSLDTIVGLVPERARNTYVVSPGPDGFGVDLEASTSEPAYPSDDPAPAAARTWAESRQECESDGEWEGGLLGAPAIADPLCGAEGDVEIGAVEPLGPNEGVPLTSAFGDEVGLWSRVIPVTAPVELRAVVAPIGQEWVVIGVLPSGEGAGL